MLSREDSLSHSEIQLEQWPQVNWDWSSSIRSFIMTRTSYFNDAEVEPENLTDELVTPDAFQLKLPGNGITADFL
ncbi:hypothetical protein ILYODFUR_023105 [Ilyodon furcidens]|uniref:Uncharacterized protein n=1 Tax=Ilyodon furcidens TaxID=33524 RepID=A0ABV0TAE9_9TELE